MASFYRSTVSTFISLTNDEILARLEVAYAKHGYTRQFSDQTLTWQRDLQLMRETLESCVALSQSAANWGILLEFSIPRKEMRIDVVLLIQSTIVVLESKSGDLSVQARRQVEEYALLLHYFHKGSTEHHIVPVLVSPAAEGLKLDALAQYEMFPQLATYWIANVITTSWSQLSKLLISLVEDGNAQIDPSIWDVSPYYPVPTIIEAAKQLRTGLSIREIAHSEASEHEIEAVRNAIQGYIDEARTHHQHIICFLTGVPGSGKTLVGLSLAHLDGESQSEAVHFMSGNGPLVKVLQHLFTQEGRKQGDSVPQARVRAKALIENVHVFARHHTEEDFGAPSNHAVIFDEAQRAWNRAQNKKKFNRDYSEPEMLLNIMERHADWAAVVALVGGGQEINDGEAGLEEWGRALAAREKKWLISASPEVIKGGESTAGHRLFDEPNPHLIILTNEALHLRTSNRSLRAEKLATWVNHVLDGNADRAASIGITEKFPVFMSRNLNEVRAHLRKHGIGENRFGLVGSSGAARLRAEGLEPSSTFHADYPWEYWYLANKSDVRSSFQCEVFATEFEIQGLELDWIGLCWGGDFVWDDSQGWLLRNFRPGATNRWLSIKKSDKRNFRRNAYRVLFTRARQGMILFVPQGEEGDPTTNRDEFEATARFLLRCGVLPLDLAREGPPKVFSPLQLSF
ncbi:MAG TPA: DNA/RNA helicase domain-containing protein [Terracidiphilus sp.]|nr:DNA/RNA helicase domain-containing protein [Terracidiphilus sp.]